MSDEAPEAGRMVRESGRLSLLTLVSRVLGLVREMTRAAFMGTAGLADSFTIGFMIPNFLRRLFAEGSVAVAFIPTFKGYLRDASEEERGEFLSAMFSALTLLVGLATALGIAAAPLVVGLFDTEPVETAALTRIMFPYLALVSFAALLQGILNSVGVFAPAAFAPILFNVCFITVPWLVSRFTANPARAMAIGVLAGGLAQALWQLPYVLRRGFRFGFVGPRRAFRNPGVRRVLTLIAPTIIGMAAYQLNDLVCTAVASRTGVGVATALTFSLRLQELILGVFAVSVGTVLLPELSGLAAGREWKRFSASLGRALDAVALVTVPVAVFSMTAGRDIVALLFKAREFDEASVDLTTGAFFWHMTGLFFIAANRLLAPAFYARGDTRNPTWAGVASFGANIALAFALATLMGGGGIAFALSLASGINMIILVVMLIKARLDGMEAALRSTLAYVARLALLSSVAAVPVLLIAGPLESAFGASSSRLVSAGLPLLAKTLVFGAIGVALLVLTKDRVASFLLSALARRARGASGPGAADDGIRGSGGA
ncbi:MAG: murein biosynthesis integral membrane protein MurJ [Spirochaetales bacterium]|nr:murein biosynthesis integral membrane protein MurJ [Spirochaetales bacterium]